MTSSSPVAPGAIRLTHLAAVFLGLLLLAPAAQAQCPELGNAMDDVLDDMLGTPRPDTDFNVRSSRRPAYGWFTHEDGSITLNARPLSALVNAHYGGSHPDGICSPYGQGFALGTLIHEGFHLCVDVHDEAGTSCAGFAGLDGEGIVPCEHFAIDPTVAAALCDLIHCLQCKTTSGTSPDPEDLDRLAGLEDKRRKLQDKYRVGGDPGAEAACLCALDHGGISDEPDDGVTCPECSLFGHPLQMPTKFDVQDSLASSGSAIPDCPPFEGLDDDWCGENCNRDGSPQED